jgi:peroxisomal enoyl-CoA hydratase 2
MPVGEGIVGRKFGREIVTIERSPVSNFARQVLDNDETYRDPRQAMAAGFRGIPMPPTYPFAMLYWGDRVEVRDNYGIEPVPPNPLGETMDQLGYVGLAMAELIEELGPGVCLHAEQEFEYHWPVIVGDVLVGETSVVDLYQRASGGVILTFLVVESVWMNAVTSEPVLTTRFTGVHRPSNIDQMIVESDSN